MPRPWETTKPFFLSAPRSAFAASRWCSLPAGCFPKLLPSGRLLSKTAAAAPSRALGAGSPVERQLFRTDFRFAPSLPQRFACGSSHSRGHGRPRSVQRSYQLRGKPLSMDCRCSDRRKSFGPAAPIAYATFVSPPNEAVAWPGAQVLDAR